MKKRKIKFNLRGKLKKFLSRAIIFLAAIGIILFLINKFLFNFFEQIEVFNIKEVVIRGAGGLDLAYLKGKNIFLLDLEKECAAIQESYPAYKNIRLTKVLPDRLCVDLGARLPFAYVKLARYFLIDEDFMVIDVTREKSNLILPVITGLETKGFYLQAGKRYRAKEFVFVLNLIREMRKNPILKDYKISRIDAVNLNSVSFFIQDNLEIKIGQDALEEKIKDLGGLLLSVRQELGNVAYIDLRFKEPVVKFK